MKRFRQSVLAAACSGRLTADWREEHPDPEPASVLLDRIRAERKAALGKNYKEPDPVDTDELPELPESWCWARAEQLCGFITKGTTPPADEMKSGSGEIPYIKVYNLTNRGALDFSVKPTFVSEGFHRRELARSRVLPGDVLMNLVGPPLGKVSIVPYDYAEWNTNQAVAIFRTMPSCDRQFFCYSLLTDDILTRGIHRAKATVGQVNLTLEIARDLPIPLPPLTEQHEIVRRVEALFALADAIEKRVATATARAEKITQSILAKAFRGELVPTEAELARAEGRDYEPACVMLERVKQERTQAGSSTKSRTAHRSKV